METGHTSCGLVIYPVDLSHILWRLVTHPVETGHIFCGLVTYPMDISHPVVTGHWLYILWTGHTSCGDWSHILDYSHHVDLSYILWKHQLSTKIVVNRTIYNEIDSDFCSLYQIIILELFFAVEIVKKQSIPTILAQIFCIMYNREKTGDIMMECRQWTWY